MRASRRTKRRRPAGYFLVAGIDMEAEMRWLCDLPVFGGDDGALAKRPPRLDVRRASARPRRNLGFAVPAEGRISVTAYPGIRPGDALEVLLHELVHIAVGRRGRSWHGQLFRRTMSKAMYQAYGIRPSAVNGSTHGVYADALERRRRKRASLHPGQLRLDTAA
jgi:hypothetical protein